MVDTPATPPSAPVTGVATDINTKPTAEEIAKAKPTDEEVEAVARGMDYAGTLDWTSTDHDVMTALASAKADALHMILGVRAVAGMAAMVSKIKADKAAKSAAAKARVDAIEKAAAADRAAKAATPPPNPATA